MSNLKVSIFTLLSFFSLSSLAQDTIVVQTLDYSKTTRDTMVQFPDGTDSYSKILMQYAMRCKGARVSTGSNRNLGCGEWDYSCNTYIEDATKADSLLSTTDEYAIDRFSGSTFNYKETAIMDYYRNTKNTTQINSSSNLDTAQVGFGTISTNQGIPGTVGGLAGRYQHLFTAQELTAAGLSAGNIWGIVVDANNTMEVSDLRINLKHSAQDSLNLKSIELGGFDNLFSNMYEFTTGSNQIPFHTPMVWDGISNILIEFTSSLSITFLELTVNSTLQDKIRSIASNDGGYATFDGTNYLESKSYEGVMGSQNRTCEAWIKTSGANQEIVGWGKDVSGQKWIFRTNTDGSLRVEVNGGAINATTPVNDDKWHHVACVLDGGNVSNIKLYVDGNLEIISATADLAINTVADIKLRISRGINDRYLVGSIDDVRIWDIALSQTDLQELMRKHSMSTDADFNNLKAYFRFEFGRLRKDDSNTGADLDFYGQQAGTHRATTLFKDFVYSSNRPNIGWITGDFDVTNSTSYTFDEVAHSSTLVKKYAIVPAYNTTINDEIVETESIERWNTDEDQIYYDDYSVEYDRITATPDGTIEINKLNYIRRWPSRLEIMSFVTPYGINLDLGQEGKTWTFDVTDFTPLLKGEKRMFLSRGGQNQEEMDIKFLFIKGTPAREVLAIDQIWPTQQYSANYSQILANDVYFPPIAYKTIDTAKGFKIRSAITGHGQEGEFIPRNHFIKANDQTFTRSVWKTCGDNPIYPQGGTWIYDRTGWCPGMATDLAEYDITGTVTGGESIALDYGLDAGSGDSRYIVNNQIVSYGEYNFGYDLGIEDIMEPSTKVEHARNNPTCVSPKMKVKNNGKNRVYSMTVEYWVNDRSNKRSFTWPCDLGSGEIETVYFPIDNSIYTSGIEGNSTFSAEIMAIEGNTTADEYKANNIYHSAFAFPDIYPQEIALFYRTNNGTDETSLQVLDEWQTVVFERSGLANSSIFRDTLRLGLGCYTLVINDAGGDGLSFFANNDGAGFFRLGKVGGGNLKILNPDFGNSTRVNFTVVHALDIPNLKLDLGYKLYPNPSTGKITITGGDLQGTKHVVYNGQGQAINPSFNYDGESLTYDLSSYPSGIYYVRMEKNGIVWSQKVIKN